MPELARTAAEMIGGMNPELWPGAHRFASVTGRAEEALAILKTLQARGA